MDGNPLKGDIAPSQLAKLLQDGSEIEGMLTEEITGLGTSPAGVLADIINTSRTDLMMIAEANGVEMSVERMTEDQAAHLIFQIVKQDGVIVDVFDGLAKQRDEIIREVYTEDEYRQYMEHKTSAMNVDNPDTWDEG